MLTNDTNIQMRQTMKGLAIVKSTGFVAGVLLALSIPVQAGSYSSNRTTASNRSGSASHATVAAPHNRVGSSSSHTSSMPVNRPTDTGSRSHSQSFGGSNSFTKTSVGSNGWNHGGGTRNGGSDVHVNRLGHVPERPVSHEGRSHVGRIPENHYRSHFGREHAFRFNHHVGYGERPSFRFGGVAFRAVQPWPMAWRETDEVYIDTVGGAYFLCNRAFPGVRLAVDPGECDSCGQEPLVATNAGPVCDQCAANTPDDSNNAPTLYRGQTCGQVVAMMGNPNRIIELGMRTIYMYPDMKVTFRGGRVSDIR